jgi:hypothetical protein
MARRRLLLALGAVLAVLVALGAVWWAARPRRRITAANCARIKKGMRMEEVEALLGGPPADYTNGRWPGNLHYELPEPGVTVEEWVSDEGVALVYFGDDGKTDRKPLFFPWDRPSILQQILTAVRRLLP